MPPSAPDTPPSAPRDLRRRVRGVGLRVFRRLPRRVRLRIVHTLAPSFTVGALAVVEHEGHLLVLAQLHRQGWTLPGGLLDRGEDPATAVARELREETGLGVDPGEPVATVVEPVTRRVDVLFHVPVDHRPKVRPRSEAVRARWLAPDELGEVDEPTRTALRTWRRALDRPAPAPGRLLPPG